MSWPKTEVSAIGQSDEGRERYLEGFRIGRIIASFQETGYDPWSKIALNSERR